MKPLRHYFSPLLSIVWSLALTTTGLGGAIETYDRLSDAESAALLDYARKTIASDLGVIPKFKPVAPARNMKGLWQKRGVFVTLLKRGELRGCIGCHESQKPLWEQVMDTARDSAFRDPRFPEVRADEFKDLEFEISAYLSPVTRISGPDAFKNGEQGVILRQGFRGATFLPHVPLEQGWTKEDTLRHLCLKAGLPEDAWKSPESEFYVYSTQIIREPKAAPPADPPGDKKKVQPNEARFYKKLPDNKVRCELCPNGCRLAPGETGVCRNYRNDDGKLISRVYGKPCSLGVETIEKAPLYHFLPGSRRLCVATPGCNMRCSFCQNWQISQCNVDEVTTYDLSPANIVALAKERGVPTICFTFTEPVNAYEFMIDVSRLADKENIRTVMVSNGYINEKPMLELLKTIDAVKIDLKGFSDKFYRDVTAGRLAPVLETIKRVKAAGVHLEIVNLVIPTLNDKPEDLEKMCRWIVKEVGPNAPTHFTRFHPDFKLRNLPPTPPSSLKAAAEAAKKAGIKYVYIGNLPGEAMNSTVCAECGAALIDRVGFQVTADRLKDGKCPACGAAIPGVWK